MPHVAFDYHAPSTPGHDPNVCLYASPTGRPPASNILVVAHKSRKQQIYWQSIDGAARPREATTTAAATGSATLGRESDLCHILGQFVSETKKIKEQKLKEKER